MAKLVAPVVEQVAQRLIEGQGTARQPLTIPTLLTEGNRRAGRDGVRIKPKRKATVELAVPRACKACGVLLERQDRDHCDDCLPEELRASAVAFRAAGRAKLETLRAQGQNPAHSSEANRRRGARATQRQREFREWDAVHGGDANPVVFRRQILPGLQGVSLGAMARATGLSEGYCSFIRRGLKVPHRKHWGVLTILVKEV